MGIIDVHCHLQDEVFDSDRDMVLKRAKDAGITKIIISALNLKEIPKALEIVEAYKEYVYLTIGCSPILTDESEVEEIQNFIKKNKKVLVGIGEVGLDYYFGEREERDIQRKFFKQWINLAKELNLPFIVHSRSAGKYAIEFLLQEEPPSKVLMHAFDGKVGWAKKGEEAGFYFTIPTSVFHSIQKQKLVKSLSINSMMLESDAPVLSPFRGERNEPINLKYSLCEISRIKNLPLESVAETIYHTTINFFNMRNHSG